MFYNEHDRKLEHEEMIVYTLFYLEGFNILYKCLQKLVMTLLIIESS
jgi:hypothetical protein